MRKHSYGRATPKGVRPAGAGRGGGELTDILDNLRDRLVATRDGLADQMVEAEVAGGAVKMTFNGLGEPVSVKVDDSVLQDREELEDLILACMRQGFENTDRLRKTGVEGLGEGVDLSQFGVDLGL